MTNPNISIVIPCFKQVQYLPDALWSVLDQDFSNWECIIVNDGSPDNTEIIAKKWLRKDNRFKYLYQENKGLSKARNFGIEHAKSKFILPLDADDKISKNYLKKAIASFQEDPTLKVVYCQSESFGEVTNSLNLGKFSLHKLSRQNMIFCSAVFKKSDWAEVGGYDDKMIYGYEDWEFWISILKHGGNVKCIDEVGFFYRAKPESMLNTMTLKEREEMYRYMNVKHAEFFVSNYGSFQSLELECEKIKSQYLGNIGSEKFVIDLFCKKFLGFTIFKKLK